MKKDRSRWVSTGGVRSAVDGSVLLARLGNWAEHVTSWLSTRRDHAGFLLVRYED